ncbi:MAG: DNA repair protein, partial [Moritella sp.]|nr:DNA repair protein [Moritella sp.]
MAKSQKIKIGSSDDIYSIMQSVVMREERIERDRELFWTICVDNAYRITNIERVSMGTVN